MREEDKYGIPQFKDKAAIAFTVQMLTAYRETQTVNHKTHSLGTVFEQTLTELIDSYSE